jgi:transposase
MNNIALFSDQHTYYLYAGRADMRKSFFGLCGIVHNELGKEVNSKDVFIFLNKRCSHIKVLVYDDKGFTLFYRKLHRGRFTLPDGATDGSAIRIAAIQLTAMLLGIDWQEYKKSA